MRNFTVPSLKKLHKGIIIENTIYIACLHIDSVYSVCKKKEIDICPKTFEYRFTEVQKSDNIFILEEF